jgi:DNA-binding protein HU-beta
VRRKQAHKSKPILFILRRNIMNKNELIANVADMYEKPKTEVKEVLDGLLETVKDALEEGEKVELFGFGNFTISERAARKGRNPQTGDEIQIAASKVVKFKPAKALKDAVNN